MFHVRLETNEVKSYLAEIKGRVENLSTFHHQVTRPLLLRQLGVAYQAAGLGIRTGRLLGSLIDPTHPEHVSEITSDSITVGTRVPYAVYVERHNPIFSRVARSNTLAQILTSTLEDHIVNG